MLELTHAEKTQLMTLWMDHTHWFPFVTDENASVTGPGHQDPEVFAAGVNAFDHYCDGGDDPIGPSVTAADVKHVWVRIEGDFNDQVVFMPCDPDDHHAMPATTIWGR